MPAGRCATANCDHEYRQFVYACSLERLKEAVGVGGPGVQHSDAVRGMRACVGRLVHPDALGAAAMAQHAQRRQKSRRNPVPMKFDPLSFSARMPKLPER